MVVGISVVNIHVFEEPSYVLIEEALDLAVVEFRVYKESADVGLHNVRERLRIVLAITAWLSSLFMIPLELFLSKSSSLVPHWRLFAPLRDLARTHDSGSR